MCKIWANRLDSVAEKGHRCRNRNVTRKHILDDLYILTPSLGWRERTTAVHRLLDEGFRRSPTTNQRLTRPRPELMLLCTATTCLLGYSQVRTKKVQACLGRPFDPKLLQQILDSIDLLEPLSAFFGRLNVNRNKTLLPCATLHFFLTVVYKRGRETLSSPNRPTYKTSCLLPPVSPELSLAP